MDETVANLAISPWSTTGDILVDITGYFTGVPTPGNQQRALRRVFGRPVGDLHGERDPPHADLSVVGKGGTVHQHAGRGHASRRLSGHLRSSSAPHPPPPGDRDAVSGEEAVAHAFGDDPEVDPRQLHVDVEVVFADVRPRR